MVALVDLDPRLDDPQMEAGEDRKTYIGTSLKSDER